MEIVAIGVLFQRWSGWCELQRIFRECSFGVLRASRGHPFRECATVSPVTGNRHSCAGRVRMLAKASAEFRW